MEKDNLFVRINFKSGNKDSKVEDHNVLNGTKIRNQEVKTDRYLIGGGFYNKNGGTIVFKAKNLEEVKQVTSDKPLIKDALIRYDVVILPKSV